MFIHADIFQTAKMLSLKGLTKEEIIKELESTLGQLPESIKERIDNGIY